MFDTLSRIVRHRATLYGLLAFNCFNLWTYTGAPLDALLVVIWAACSLLEIGRRN